MSREKGLYKQTDCPKEYLEARIKKTESCWLWLKGKDKDGYGQCHSAKSAKILKVTRAHQLAYVVYRGPIKKGLFVCHTCDNPSCVNPGHLFLGTPLENNHDMIKKNRQYYPKGEASGNNKLTKKEADQIKKLKGKESSAKVADMFNISFSRVCQIWRGEGWI